MIKLIFLILLFSSCSSLTIDTGPFGPVKNFIIKEKINIDDEFISSMRFSFILVTFERNQAIFVLSNISNDGIYTWIGANNERIKTLNGMIIEIYNFDPEFSINFIKDINLTKNFPQIGNDFFKLRVSLSKPDLEFLLLNYSRIIESNSIKLPWVNSSKKKKDYSLLVQFKKFNKDIGWNAVDSYYILNDQVIQTTQSINPLYPPLKLQFFYKY
jgi:hypothetical protein